MEDLLRTTYQSVRDGTSKPQVFVQLADEIDWTSRTSDELAETIKMALELDMISLARRLIAIAAEYNIVNEKIERLGKVLAPPKVIATNIPPKPWLADSMRWMRENARNYMGKWIALAGDTLLGTADTRRELLEMVGERTDILVTRID